jgi:Spy/CpxP family protein refolding chaperone
MEYRDSKTGRFLGIRIATWVFAVVTAAALGTSTLKAEENASSTSKPKPAMCGMDCMEKGGEEGRWNLKETLGLTDEQAKKMDSIKEAKKAEIEPLREKIRALSDKLKSQLDAKASDSDLKATLEDIRSTHESMAAALKKFHGQMKDILTPTQQAKMTVKMMEFRHHHGWGHKGKP